MQKEIGQRIKDLRQSQGLTLKELSDRTKLSISFLSMVERGLTSIAIISLQSIAEALGENVSSFFSQEPSQSFNKHAFCRSFEPRIRHMNDKYIYTSLANDMPQRAIDPMMITLLPGQKREEVYTFCHDGEEFTYVLEGILTFFLDDKEYQLYPGDSYHGPCNVPHHFVNFTNNLVKVLFVITPPLELNRRRPGGTPVVSKVDVDGSYIIPDEEA